MPTVDPVDFTRLAEAISDGDAVDWAAAGSQASPADRRVLDALKVVSEIAGLHRTMPPSAGERPAELFAGDVWAHLTLREVIGRGAYGVVYRAWDPQLDREVALKLISESSQRDQAMIVVDEGRLLAKVRHRGVVTVYGAAREAGFAGLWMELIQGATLRGDPPAAGPLQRARGGALRRRGVRGAGRRALRRPAAPRRQGAERDARSQRPHRADGLRHRPAARAARRGGRSPTWPARRSTWRPELFSGGAASTQTDVYSVGVLLFRLVTGSFPLPARSLAEVRLGHAQNRARRLRDERSDLPSRLRQHRRAGAGRDPARRYESAGALELALTGFLATSVELSRLRPPARAATPWPPLRVPRAAAAGAIASRRGLAARGDAGRRPRRRRRRGAAWLPPRRAGAPIVAS